MTKDEAVSKIEDYLKRGLQSDVDNTLDFLDDSLHTIKIEDFSFILRELTWKEAVIIDAMSFKKKSDELYFSSESEKKLILSNALISVLRNDEVEQYTFSDFDYGTVEKVWVEYQKFLHLTNSETNFLYQVVKKYFTTEQSEVYPVHPFVIEVDYMLKGIVSLSKAEFAKFTIKQFEALQLILSIKNSM
jgi:hypothetical protein